MKKIMTVILAIMICLQAFIPCLAFEELSKGSKGNAVVELQNRLNELGYDVGKADGDFGSKTEKAIRQFQQDNELAISGKLDNDTYVLLFSINTEDNNLPESKPDDMIEDTPLFLIEGTNGYGYCDSNGNTIISCQWAYAIDFSGDIAGVKDSSEKWGAINKSGNTVVACDWQSVHDITDGYICFQNGYGDAIRYAVFDSEGNEVLPPSEYRRHLYFGDGIAVWITENTGNPVCFDLTTHNTTQIDKYYRTVEEGGFSEGLLQVRHGYIDKAGKLIIDMSNQDYLLSAFHDGLALVYDNSNKKEGYIDTSGSLAIPFQWPGDCADDFSEGMARVKKQEMGYTAISMQKVY